MKTDKYEGVYLLRSCPNDTLRFDGIPEAVYPEIGREGLEFDGENGPYITPLLYQVKIERDEDGDLVLIKAEKVSGYIPPEMGIEGRIKRVLTKAMYDLLAVESRHGYEAMVVQTVPSNGHFHLKFVLPELRVGVEVHVDERYGDPDWRMNG